MYSGIVVQERMRRVLAVSTACPHGITAGIGRLFHQSNVWGAAAESRDSLAGGGSTDARDWAAERGVCAWAAPAALAQTTAAASDARSEARPRER